MSTIKKDINNPQFKRRNLEYFKFKFGGWIGWDKFTRDYNSCDDGYAQEYMACLFALGSRVSEIGTLTPRQIDVETYPKYVQIKQMYVEKQKDFVEVFDAEGKPVLRPDGKPKLMCMSKAGYRTFLIHKKEPTTDVLLECVNDSIKHNEKYGVKNPDEQSIFTDSRFSIYYHLSKIGADPDKSKRWNVRKGIYHPHMMRSLRASYLAGVYKYTIPQLMKFFGWEDAKEPTAYASLTADNLIINPEYEPK